MGTRRKEKPSLEDAGKLVFRIDEGSSISQEVLNTTWNGYTSEEKKKYTKIALEIWREVERCI